MLRIRPAHRQARGKHGRGRNHRVGFRDDAVPRAARDADPVAARALRRGQLQRRRARLRIRSRGINFIACPTCSRQEFDVIKTVNELEQRLEDITLPMDVSIIGCVVNGPGEALVSTLGVAGGHNKSSFYEGGVRQKERFDNDKIINQLENKIRARVAMMNEK